jgi:hypothetical protein
VTDATPWLLVEEAAPQGILLAGPCARLRRILKNIPMAIDVVMCSRDDVEERQDLHGTRLYHALRRGKVLYDATRACVGTPVIG